MVSKMYDYTNTEEIDLSFQNKTFYGFRYNNDTGKLVIEVINDGSPVRFPTDGVVRKTDYKAWFWTKHTVQFDWDTDPKSNLLMEIL